jgi:hypothetical protein
MNKFDVTALAWILHEMSTAEIAFQFCRLTGRAAAAPGESERGKATKALGYGEILFKSSNLDDALRALTLAKEAWERPILDNSAASEIMHRLQIDIIEALKNRHFLRIADDRPNLIDQDKLFGDVVSDGFVSARRDITEAGNCLATECNTAAVFHLMRACEFALRALARDRQVSFKDKPLEQKEWGQILPKLDSVVKEMRESDIKNWLKPEFKDAQIHFYSELVPELRSFNEAWRRHLSHADTEAFYGRNQAISIMNHVKKFMEKLSTRVTENKCMPMYWDSL